MKQNKQHLIFYKTIPRKSYSVYGKREKGEPGCLSYLYYNVWMCVEMEIYISVL